MTNDYRKVEGRVRPRFLNLEASLTLDVARLACVSGNVSGHDFLILRNPENGSVYYRKQP